MKKFCLILLILLVLRAMDLFLTYLYIPDLQAEYNPLVALWGLSWNGFLAAQGAIFIVIAFFAYQYAFLPPVVVSEEKLKFHDFVYSYFNGHLKPWPDRIHPIPKSVRPHLIFNGFIFASAAMLVSLFAIINNTLLLLGIPAYVHFIENHYRTFIPLMFTACVLASFFLFFIWRYRAYLKGVDHP